MNKLARMLAAALMIAFVAALAVPEGKGSAASRGVAVTLPSFPVSLNGHAVDSRTRAYPLLVYKDITYFPMTWHDSRLLGLETAWSPQEGLSVTQTRVTGRYEPYASAKVNPMRGTAQIADGPVRINGELIDNAAEPYPLLTFRDVTYFPLTWRFAHDAFGWDYHWDAKTGLSITTTNPRVADTGLPQEAGDNGLALYRGSFYYVETAGTVNRIFRAPKEAPRAGTEIYRYDAAYIDGADTQMAFHLEDRQLWMRYRIGYEQFLLPVSENGALQESYTTYRAYLDFRDTPYGRLVVNVGLPDERNGNLHMMKEDGSKRPVGAPEVTAFGQSVSKNRSTPTTVVGEEVYLLLRTDLPRLYRINLRTDETVMLAEAVDWFTVGESRLYYVRSSDKKLFRAELDGSDAKPLSDHPVLWFDAVGDAVFYTSRDEAGKLVLYRAEDAEDKRLLADPVSSVTAGQGQLLVVTDGASAGSAYILDGRGELLWQVAEPLSQVFASDEGWLVRSARDGRVLLIQ